MINWLPAAVAVACLVAVPATAAEQASPSAAHDPVLDGVADEAAIAPRPNVLPQNWQQMIEAKLEAHLKDPYSAVKKVTRGPRYGSVREDAYTVWQGWAVCYSINAKNAYGGYTGAKPYLFVVNSYGVVGMIDKADESVWFEAMVKRECSLAADPAPPAASE